MALTGRSRSADRGARIAEHGAVAAVHGARIADRSVPDRGPWSGDRGARYVWQGEREAERGMFHFFKRHKKPRTMAGLIGSG